MSDNPLQASFLQELYRLTKGESEQQASMYDVGAGLGLEKNEAGKLAEQLMVDGLIDLKTLAGGIGFTEEGLASIGYSTSTAPHEALKLSDGPVASDQDRKVIEQILTEIRQTIQVAMKYETMEILVVHLKTIDVQLLSPQPRLPVIKELFFAIAATMQEEDITPPAVLSSFL